MNGQACDPSRDWFTVRQMAKSKRKKKVKRRDKGGARGAVAPKSGSRSGSKGGSMMSMRSGFKSVAGTLVGKESKTKKGQTMTNIFWWVVTIVLGVAAAVILYRRYG